MTKKFTSANLSFIIAMLISICFSVSAQTTVFSDTFTTSTGTTYSTATGAIGTSSNWNLSRSGVDMGAAITSGLLFLSNDATTAGNANGWVLASTSTAAFAAPYATTLNANAGLLSWTFNMRQPQGNPNGFTSGLYATAFILAGTSNTTTSAGSGYAVILGNSGKVDPVKLVNYTNGIASNTTIVSSNTSGLSDFGSTYLSVKVTYAPDTSTWQLFVRNDGAAFLDPVNGSLTLQGTAVNNTSTAVALPLMGALWNASTRANAASYYDNIKVSVVVPNINSLSPPSVMAGSGLFTLTVNGSGFINGTSVVKWNGSSRATTFISANQLTALILATDITAAGSANVTVANGSANSNVQLFTIDPIGVPTIGLSISALNAMTTITGTASASQSYTVNGSSLTADVVVTAPTNFEISVNNSTFSNSITLPRTGSILVGQPVTLYVRVAASAPAGLYSATISHATSGGASKFESVSASVLAAEPTTQATLLTFTTVTSTTFNVNWSNGNGANNLVVIRSGGAVNSNPVDGASYTANNAIGAGSEIGTGNFVLYAGNASTVAVSGLLPNTTYHVAVYGYNGSASTENYLIATPAIGNRTTLSVPVGWQIYATNTTNQISFDSTVDGVNEGAYQAAGMSPTLTPGELNSGAWAISGFSDGSIAFNGTSTDGQDFDRGTAASGVSTGGVYAFETASNNFALGIQPASSDFVPGAVTLRFQNQTGVAVTSVSIGYKVYVYNDQPASNSFNFSHSANNSTYSNVSGLNVISVATADAVPAWKSYYRVVTLTGLNIADGQYYYFKWAGATVSGSTNFDEFALDDVVMVANPTTNFASFSGVAENFIVLGNTMLAGATTVTSDLTINGGKVGINGATLTLNGTLTNTTTQGLKGSAASNLIVSGAVNATLSFDQTSVGTTNLLNNLTIATTSANTVSLANSLVVNGTLVTNLGQTFNLGTNTLTGSLANISNNGTITTQNTSATPIESGKSWNGTGVFNYNASGGAQTVVGGTYTNLTISSSGGAAAATSFTVNGILNLPTSNPTSTSGSLAMGTFVLTMGGNATNAGIGDVSGIITRTTIVPNVTYTLGNPYTSIVFPNTGTLPTSMSLKVALGTAPTWRTGAINRTFDFIQTGAVGTKAIIKAHYLDGELNGNNENKLVDWAHIVASATTLEQGRSNYSTTDNWIELTNVNVGLYFTGTFGQVLLSLDESTASSLTWNGSVSSSWTTATNWTPNATPSDFTIVYIPDAATTPNDPILNPVVLLGSLNIEVGGILNTPDDAQFTIKNSAGAWINYGTFNPGAGTSTVTFTGTDATMSGSTTFNSLVINSGSAVRPLTGNVMQIANQLTINGALLSGAMDNTVIFSGTNQSIPNPNGPSLNAYNNLIINGTGAIFPTALNIMGTLTLNQDVDFTGKSLSMNGLKQQFIEGTVAPLFNNLIINNSAGGVTLLTNTTVNGTLTLTFGILTVSNSNLSLSSAAVAGSFSATSMIVTDGNGEVRRNYSGTGSYTFPVGDVTDVAEYSPISVNVTAGTFSSAYVGVAVVDAVHPNNTSASNNISRYWKVNQSGITGAVATISATYLPTDLTGSEETVSAAQLKGIFNQVSNPWKKYGALASNTLTAAGALLTAGQIFAYTGVKGGTYSVVISNYGTFCLNDDVTLTATPIGGDAPYTYLWTSGLGYQSTAVPSSSTAGTTLYSVTVIDSNGSTATDAATVIIASPPVAGVVTCATKWCYNKQPDNITVSGFTGTVQKWQYATDAGFTNPIDIASTAAVLEQSNAQFTNTTIYYRAVIGTASSCPNVTTAAIAILGADLATYTGGAWVPGAPNSINTSIVFDDNYAPVGAVALTGCDCTVNGGRTVVIPSASVLNLQNEVNVSAAAGTKLTFENNAALLQASNNFANTGVVEVKRNSSALMRLDYTLWSSPVYGVQTLKDFSPATFDTRFYLYNTATNFYNATSPYATSFGLANVGKGFLIRMPNDHPTTPTVWTAGKFIGTPSNGTIPVAITTAGSGFNLIGNPYLSQININQFLADNSANIEPTLYFWRKTNEAVPSNPVQSGYCTYSGGILTQGSASTNGTDPLGKIQIGQGFMVQAKAGATSVTFNNGMRINDTANHFFRFATNPEQRNTYWLNLVTATGGFAQMAVCYRDNATMGVDVNDGLNIGDGQVSIGSYLDNRNFIIQSRTLPFDLADVTPLTFTVNADGNYTLAIDHFDGLFMTVPQHIYVRDNVTNTLTNLSTGNYTFATTAGTFNNRFEIVYQTALNTAPASFNQNSVVVYKNNNDIAVNTGKALIKTIQVYDMRGSLLFSKTNINAAEFQFNIGATNQVVLVKTILEEGQVVTKKIVN